MTPTIQLLVPTAAQRAATRSLAGRPRRIARLAFLHNGQPHFDGIAPAILEHLRARELDVREYRKPRYSSPAAEELIEEIAAGCDAAVVGLAC